MTTKTFTLLLTPADVSLFREPRPFQPGDTSLTSTLPTPQATAGAVRTWLLESMGLNLAQLKRNEPIEIAITSLCPDAEWIVKARLRGPLLCNQDGEALLVAPQHLLGEESGDTFLPVGYMFPSRTGVPGSSPPVGAPDSFKPIWLPTDRTVEPTKCYVDLEAMTQILRNKMPHKRKFIQSKIYFDFERRLGIGMNSNRNTREETLIYSAGFLRLDGVRFRVDLEIDATKETELRGIVHKRPWLMFGGEKRVASVEITEHFSDFPNPPVPWSASEEILFTTYLATPGLFENGKWLPRTLMGNFELVSAVVGAPLPWSSWSRVTNQPGPSRYAVQTGAVYFWRKPKNVEATDPHGTCISDDPADAQAGWGLCLRGVWTYVE